MITYISMFRVPSRFLGTLLLCILSAQTQANPTGAQVIAGQVDFSPVNPKVLEITNTPNSIINWQSFSIGADEVTRFIQQGASSAVLNRVVGDDLSSILGQLQSNGRLFLINPNGIVFGPGSVVDVAGLVASTLNLSDEDFLQGNYMFLSDGSASLINQGTLQALDDVLLIASDITNEGAVFSENGNVLLAAGESVRAIDPQMLEVEFEVQAPEHEVLNLGDVFAENVGIFAGTIDQSGSVRADSVTVDAAGRVILHAADTTWLQGETTANSAGGHGGAIDVLGRNIGVMDGALVDASGAMGGGEVRIGGNQEGSGPLPNAEAVYVDAHAAVRADATENGDGGTVIVYADDVARVRGSLSARGAGAGAGGFIETSGKRQLELTRTPDVTAPSGLSGEWLIDPSNLFIVSGGVNETASLGGGIFESDDDPTSSIGVDFIEDALSGGATVTLRTGSGGSGSGFIDWQSGAFLDLCNTTGFNTLRLEALNLVQFQGEVGFLGADGGQGLALFLTADTDDTGSDHVYLMGDINLGTNGLLDTRKATGNTNEPFTFVGSPTVASVTIDGTFVADRLGYSPNGATFVLNGTGSTGDLVMNTGSSRVTQLQISDMFTISDTFNWNAGYLVGDGSATLTVGPTGSLVISSGSSTHRLDNLQLLHASTTGTSIWTGTSNNGIDLLNSASFNNTGEFRISGGVDFGADSASGTFINAGILNADNGTTPSVPVKMLTSYQQTAAGTLNLNDRVFRLAGGGSIAGSVTTANHVNIANGATLQIFGTAVDLTTLSNIGGLGELEFFGSALNQVVLSDGIDVGRIQLINATVNFSNSVKTDSLFVEIQGSVAPTLTVSTAGTRLDVEGGTFFWEAGTINGTNNNIIDASTASSVLLNADESRLMTGFADLRVPNLPLTMGSLELRAGSILSVTNDFTVADLTTFTLTGGTVNVGGTFGVAGIATLNGGAFDTLLLDVDPTGSLTLDGSSNSLTVNDQTVDTQIDGTLTMQSSSILNLGRELIIGAGGTFNMNAGTVTWPASGLSERLFIDGVLNYSQGGLAPPGGFLVRSGGLMEVTSVVPTTLNSSNGQLNVSSGGTFRKLADGTQTTTLGMRLGTSGGTVDLLAGTLDLSASGMLLQGSTTFNLNGGALIGTNLRMLNGNLFAANGSTINGNLTVDGGTLHPGSSPGILDITGDLTIGAGGTVNIEVGGTTQGSDYDWIDVGGTATLDGTLNVSLINSFAPSNGDSFQFLTAGTAVSGTFATTNLPANFSVAYNATDVLLDFSTVLNQNLWTGGGDGVSWGDPANWGNSAVPTSSEDVQINITGTVTYNRSADTILSLALAQDTVLRILGGDLTLSNASTINGTVQLDGGSLQFDAASTIASLSLNGGTLRGAGAVSILDDFTWRAGTLAGAGDFILAGGNTNSADDAVIDINTFVGNDLFLDERSFINNSANTDNVFQASDLWFQNGARFTNNGYLLTKVDAVFGDSADPANNANGTFINAGTLVADGAINGRTDYFVPWENTGSLRLQNAAELTFWSGATSTAGSFELLAGTDFHARACANCGTPSYSFTDTTSTGTGDILVAEGVPLAIDSSSFSAGQLNSIRSPVTLAGTLALSELIVGNTASATINGDLSISDRLQVSGTGIADFSAGSLTMGSSSELSFNFGGTLRGGTLNLPAGVELSLVGGTLDGVQLVNASTNPLNVMRSTVSLLNGALLTNNGLIQSTQGVRFTGDGSLVNNGTFSLDDSNTGTGTYVFETAFAQNGTLSIADSGGGGAFLRLYGDMKLDGTLNINGAGVEAQVNSTTAQQVLAGSLIAGTGRLVLDSTLEFADPASSGLQTVVSAGILNDGVFRVASGRVDISSAAKDPAGTGIWDFSGGNVNLGTLVINSGTIPLNGILNGTLDLSGGNATLAPGASPGLAIINGDLILGSANTLAIEIFGTGAGTQYDQVQVQNLTLGGAAVNFNFGTFTPSASDVFHFLTYSGSVTGPDLVPSGQGSGLLSTTSNSIALSFLGSGVTPAPFVFPSASSGVSTSGINITNANSVLTNNPQPTNSPVDPTGTGVYPEEEDPLTAASESESGQADGSGEEEGGAASGETLLAGSPGSAGEYQMCQ